MNNVLITGGTGFLGRGLVRELMARGTERICIFSRDEAKQAAMRSAIEDPDARLHWFVGDVRDRQRLVRAMYGVDTVIHAAALKRVETGEYNPGELVKTNVLGTMNVIEAAFDVVCVPPRHVVYVSSDKACQPLNAYGASKLMGEKLVLGAHNTRGKHGPILSAVRYGNVAGSTGSVIQNWREVALGIRKNLCVTDPKATRFWMTLQQAINLVLGTAEMMVGGELVIPPLPAYRLADLITAMGIDPLATNYKLLGLGPGEKLHERMQEDGPTSEQVHRMTIEELREGLTQI